MSLFPAPGSRWMGLRRLTPKAYHFFRWRFADLAAINGKLIGREAVSHYEKFM
jgi:hypothetical protein